MKLKVGQVVRVKKGTDSEDESIDIVGWQGRIGISEEGYGPDMILVEWDSITMQNMPEDYILTTIRITDEDEFNHFYLYKKDVEPAEERDTLKDVRRVKAELCKKYEWKAFSSDSPEDKLLVEIVDFINTNDSSWWEYLEENLKFPFEAIVSEGRELGKLLKVFALADEDEMHGIISFCKIGRSGTHYPLCDLKAKDEKSKNYLITRAYAIWFANQ